MALRRAAQRSFALQFIREIREKDPGIGGVKLWYMYQRDFQGNDLIGRDQFVDIINDYGLKVRLKVRKPRTTDSTHGLPTFPNIIKDFIPTAPNQLWVSDITYITIWLDEYTYIFCYLSLILDAYTEEIIGWSVGPTLEMTYPVEALRMALKRIEGMTYKIRSITTQSHGKKSSSFFGASPPKNAKNLIKIARARTSAASLFGALPPRRGQEGQKGARRPSVSEHMHPLL